MYPPYKPFKIVLTKEGSISHVVFKEGDPIWSMNFKRAIASTLQFQIKSTGAFVVDEVRMRESSWSTAIFIGVARFLLSFRRASMAAARPSTLCPTKPMDTYPYARHPSWWLASPTRRLCTWRAAMCPQIRVSLITRRASSLATKPSMAWCRTTRRATSLAWPMRRGQRWYTPSSRREKHSTLIPSKQPAANLWSHP